MTSSMAPMQSYVGLTYSPDTYITSGLTAVKLWNAPCLNPRRTVPFVVVPSGKIPSLNFDFPSKKSY